MTACRSVGYTAVQVYPIAVSDFVPSGGEDSACHSLFRCSHGAILGPHSCCGSFSRTVLSPAALVWPLLLASPPLDYLLPCQRRQGFTRSALIQTQASWLSQAL